MNMFTVDSKIKSVNMLFIPAINNKTLLVLMFILQKITRHHINNSQANLKNFPGYFQLQ